MVGGHREALVGVAATALRMIRLTSNVLINNLSSPLLGIIIFLVVKRFFPFFFFLFRFLKTNSEKGGQKRWTEEEDLRGLFKKVFVRFLS